MGKEARAESRCRYLVRRVAEGRGWNVRHISRGGDFLEEQEIENAFPGIGLKGAKPDFLICHKGFPAIVVEAKNDMHKIDAAVKEAVEYADQINQGGKYSVTIAVGAAGNEDFGNVFKTMFRFNGTWIPLQSHGYELTGFPSVSEVESALITHNGTAEVSIPPISEFVSTAISLSVILREAKIEAPLRPKVLGAVITALFWGEIDLTDGREIASINSLVNDAISSTDHFSDSKKGQLIETLKLSESDASRLSGRIGRIVHLLKNLNIRSVMRTDTDFLGILYEAFIRYGYDNNALGIVFTPRHITRFCADLIDVSAVDTVIDIACGSGGFLVSSYDRMRESASRLGVPHSTIREALYGFDTNPTVWALAALNMFFRGDGKSHIENRSCFDDESRRSVRGRFSKALLNPPFSQAGEPERDFITSAMDTLRVGGLLAVVVKSGIFADEENALWRHEFLKRHSVLAMISLPGDLFYPTAVDTTIMVARAGCPQRMEDKVFVAKVWNDGFRKLKGKRVETGGSQLPEVLAQFRRFQSGEPLRTGLANTISASVFMEPGAEFCPEQHLQQPLLGSVTVDAAIREVTASILRTTVCVPDISDSVIEAFPDFGNELPALPYGEEMEIENFFTIGVGKSRGEMNYISGTCPYVSSGDPQNSIVRLVDDVRNEVFTRGGITVTCFGQACVQPWRFMARGNGGSSVRVLTPRFRMSYAELAWFAAQINLQRWRFFYGRMAIKKRLFGMRLTAPSKPLPDAGMSIAAKIRKLSSEMDKVLRG